MSKESRRDFLKKIGLGAAALAFPSSLLSKRGTQQRPNIIFIMADDHASHALSCYGSRINKTPNLDRIANEGMRFSNCFCTNSICAPSRASILTGLYSHAHGVLDNKTQFREDAITFPEILRQNGYETALFGKWHLKIDPVEFDYYSILPGQGEYYNPDFIQMGQTVRYEGHVTDVITDQVLNWLQSRESSKPFCLLYQFKAPHSNFMPGLRYLNRYNDVEIPLPETFFDEYTSRTAAAPNATMHMSKDFYHGWHLKLNPNLDHDPVIRKIWSQAYDRMSRDQKRVWDAAYEPKNKKYYQSNLTDKELMIWNYQRFIKDYLRCVDGIDNNVGRVLNYLESTDLEENTIVIYTSDQGFFLGDHGWWDKRFMYEESIRMPLMVKYPGKEIAGYQSDAMVLNIDIAPTILNMAGVPVPPTMQGRSYRKLVLNEKVSDWRKAMYYHYYEYPGRPQVKKHYGIRTQRYKLIHFYDDIDAWELYDLKRDPQELNNIYHVPKYQNIVEELRKELKQLQIHYKATLL